MESADERCRKKERERGCRFAEDHTSLRSYTPISFQIRRDRGNVRVFLPQEQPQLVIHKFARILCIPVDEGIILADEHENPIATLVFCFGFTQGYSCEYSSLDVDILHEGISNEAPPT